MNQGIKQRFFEFFNKRDVRTAGIFALGGVIAGILVGLYIETSLGTLLSPEELEEIMTAMPESSFLVALLGAVQVGIITFLTALIGLKFARKLGLKFAIVESLANREPIPEVSKAGLKFAILLGLFVAFVIVLAERFYFQGHIPILEDAVASFSLVALLSGIFYGGIVEEVLLRLFLMSILLWVVARFIVRTELPQIPKAVYWSVIVLVALVFAALHLPNASLFLGELTAMLIFRIMLLNTLGGVIYGWLYWKYGIEYAIVSHMMTHIGMQLVFIPIVIYI